MKSVSLTIIFGLISPVFVQQKFNIADSINKFSIDLLNAVNQEAGDDLNIALAPLTIWTMLTVMSEGAYNSTADEIEGALGLPQNKNNVRDAYERLTRQFQITKSKETDIETTSGIFARSEFRAKEKFADIVKRYYSTSITPVDFKGDGKEAAEIINKYVAEGTKNRIPMLVGPADVQDAYIFVTSTMYFKGQWKTPFNISATQKDTFFDDKKKSLGQVQMMYQAYPYAYDRNDKIKADIVELPYGFNDEFSMLVFVPRGFQTINQVISALAKEPISQILADLKKNHELFPEDDTHVYLPKFKISSDFNMNGVLEKLGIKTLFDQQKANLLGMFPHYLYLSRFIQKAEIEVDEEGTVASGASGAIFLNRTPPPVVRANRPFAFCIVHKQSGAIIFAGKISNPNDI